VHENEVKINYMRSLQDFEEIRLPISPAKSQPDVDKTS